MQLAQQKALVTGGASGIGRAIVERFVASGAKVIIADIDEGAGRDLARRLGPSARFAMLDIASANQWASTIADATAWFGTLTCLVNNAGIGLFGSIASTTEIAWRRTLDVNATGTFLGCQQAVAAMANTGGAIINIASVRGQRRSSGQIAYCASKALVISLTESVALHCGEEGLPIRCNAVCPGVIDTPILTELKARMGGNEVADQLLGDLQLLHRLGRPQEIASAVAYLASDEASFVTGTTLNVDGGFRIRDR